jgi:hypothetical protein
MYPVMLVTVEVPAGLIRRVQGGIVANSDVIRAFLPERRALGNDESAPPSGRT